LLRGSVCGQERRQLRSANHAENSPLTATIHACSSPALSPDTERALTDEADVSRRLLAAPRLYAIGTQVNATGERNFRQSRREFDALPFATDVCAA